MEPKLVSDKKNILIFIPSLGGGGAERVACRLANGLSKKHKVYLIYYAHQEQTYYVHPDVQKIEFSVRFRHRCPAKLRKWYDILYKAAAVTLARQKYRIDTCISFMDRLNLVNVLALGSCRVIVSDRNDPVYKTEESMRESLYAHRFADYAVFQTRKAQRMYPEEVGQKSCIIPNPTEVSCYASECRAKKIVTVGRLHKQKNQKMLIRAFALFHKLHSEYHLYIYGEGDLLNELTVHATSYGVGDFVHFEGFRGDVHMAIADAEQFVLSSDYEGLPNALMEAMMMGHACISTACAGSDELINDGKNGLLVPVGDAEALCDAMCRLSDDPELRMHLGEAASVSAEAWRTENVIRLWERIL